MNRAPADMLAPRRPGQPGFRATIAPFETPPSAAEIVDLAQRRLRSDGPQLRLVAAIESAP